MNLLFVPQVLWESLVIVFNLNTYKHCYYWKLRWIIIIWKFDYLQGKDDDDSEDDEDQEDDDEDADEEDGNWSSFHRGCSSFGFSVLW